MTFPPRNPPPRTPNHQAPFKGPFSLQLHRFNHGREKQGGHRAPRPSRRSPENNQSRTGATLPPPTSWPQETARPRIATLTCTPHLPVVEVVAAVAGAAITVGAMGLGSATRSSRDGREAVIKLTAAVENVALRLEELHVDIKADRKETYQRLNGLEQRVAKLEATQ